MNVGSGDTMGGRYMLTDRIAAGGMGEVWAATDAILGRTVAVKVLKGGLTDDIGFDERFRTAARLAAALTHATIAAVYDYGEDEGSAYLVMEYVPGLPLSRIIADRAPMPAVDTVGLVAQTATALQSAHRSGLVHHDVKAANVLVTADGIVKLTDFGIARAVGSATVTRTGEVMGTAQYLAPGAALGQETTPLSDVYALAVVAYEMLCGFRPLSSDSPVALAMAHVNEPPRRCRTSCPGRCVRPSSPPWRRIPVSGPIRRPNSPARCSSPSRTAPGWVSTRTTTRPDPVGDPRRTVRGLLTPPAAVGTAVSARTRGRGSPAVRSRPPTPLPRRPQHPPVRTRRTGPGAAISCPGGTAPGCTPCLPPPRWSW